MNVKESFVCISLRRITLSEKFSHKYIKRENFMIYTMLELGIVRPLSSNWASSLHMVPKKIAGDWHSCGDYLALSNATIPNRCPILHIKDPTAMLDGAAVFSRLNLV